VRARDIAASGERAGHRRGAASAGLGRRLEHRLGVVAAVGVVDPPGGIDLDPEQDVGRLPDLDPVEPQEEPLAGRDRRRERGMALRSVAGRLDGQHGLDARVDDHVAEVGDGHLDQVRGTDTEPSRGHVEDGEVATARAGGRRRQREHGEPGDGPPTGPTGRH